MSQKLEELGKTVGEVSDRLAETEDSLSRARRRLLAGPGGKHGAPRRARWLLAAASLAVAVVALVLLPRPHSDALWFELGSQRGRVGDWIAADRQSVRMRFSEGSDVTVQPGSRMRVTQIDERGAELLIEHGAARAAFTSKPSARWLLRAGPFAIRVTGTVFDTQWEPNGEVLRVTMTEGSVVVAGPLLDGGRRVVAGEQLYVSVKEGRMEVRTQPSESPPLAAPAVAQTAPAELTPAPLPEEVPVAQPGSDMKPRASTAADWQKLIQSRRYAEAMTKLDELGIEKELQRASSEELLLLSDGARFAGRPELAQRSLLSARQRFNLKGRTAFLLGKIAAEQLSDRAQAITWFETYLREEPGGAFSEQALGRLIDLKRKTNPEAAAAHAQRYLALYPNGSYAALARSVAQR